MHDNNFNDVSHWVYDYVWDIIIIIDCSFVRWIANITTNKNSRFGFVISAAFRLNMLIMSALQNVNLGKDDKHFVEKSGITNALLKHNSCFEKTAKRVIFKQ